MIRRRSKEIKIGNIKIGGNNPIAIQSMVKIPTKNYRAVIAQAQDLQRKGCSMLRLAIKDQEDACAISQIKKAVNIPLVADIHFDWKLAVSAIRSGIDKIRLNPGNIYKREEIKEIAKMACDYSIPIRVGLNSGSIPKTERHNLKLSLASKLVKAALSYIKILEDLKFNNIVVSLKCSNVLDTIEAYREIAKKCDYPLHLGLTATGSSGAGKIKSAVALGILLFYGIGDTIRVSLTGSPEEEVKIAKSILSSLGLGNFGPEIISCPTCGRTEVDIEKIVNELEEKLSSAGSRLSARPIKLAVMGCVVNGPGEAMDADLAIAFGKKDGLLYKNSKPQRKVSADRAVDELIKEWGKLCLKI